MAENIHLVGRDLEQEIPLWMGVHGTEVISNERVKFEYTINKLPVGQVWTSQNLHLSSELDSVSQKYVSEHKENNTVLTLQACAFKGIDININSPIETIFAEAQLRRGWRRVPVSVNFLEARYFEAAAYTNRAVPEMVNPHAVVVSVEAITKDKKFIFARRNDSSGTGSGQLGVIGGVLEGDPKQQAISEIEEELAIAMYPEDDTEDLFVSFSSICFDNLNRPIIIYRARIPYTQPEIVERWSLSQAAKSEHKDIVFVDANKDALLDFAKRYSPSDFHSPANLILANLLKGYFYTEEEDQMMGGMSG